MTRRPSAAPALQLPVISAGIEQRLAESPWAEARPGARASLAARPGEPTCEAAAEVATFALALSGRRRPARRGGRLSRLVASFALAASVALASLAAGCSKPDAGPEATAQAVQQLESVPGSVAAITAGARASPARYTDLRLVEPPSASQPWAVMAAGDTTAPVLVDGQDAGLTTAGAVYSIPAHAIPLGTRDGASQFLSPDAPAQQTADASGASTADLDARVAAPWRLDERFAAATRAIAGQPTVLDAAYNAAAAVQAGGTHTYTDGVVLRADPTNSSLQVIDKGLLQSLKPTRPEDMVFVAIRPEEASLYNPGQVVTLRDVVMTAQAADVQGQQQTVYIANAALQGARVEPTDTVDLQSILNQRLELTNADLAAEATGTTGTPAAGTSAAVATPTAAPATAPQQPIIVERGGGGPSFLEDFLIWTWLTQPRYYGGSGVTIINPPASRASGNYYYTPPTTAPPQAPAPQGQATRGAAIQASRSAVSGQASGTGGGVAATNKAAADSTARASAATAKGSALAGSVAAASAGKSTASAPSSASTTASRSSGRASTGGTTGSSSSAGSGAKSSGGSSGAGASSGGSRTGGFGGTGGSSSSSS